MKGENTATTTETSIAAATAVLEEGVDFTVTCDRPSIIDRIRYRTFRGAIRRTFVIYPIKLGTLLRISKLLLSMKTVSPDKQGLGDFAASAITDNTGIMVEIAALAIVNDNRKTPKSLIRYLDRNLSARELRTLIDIVMLQMDIVDFFGCMVSMKSLNLFGTMNQETATSGEQSEALSNTSASDGTKSSGEEAGRTS